MDWIRERIQKWIDKKTEEVIKVNKALREIVGELEQSQTIGELREKINKIEEKRMNE